MQRHFRTIQFVSDPKSGLLASHLGIVALRIANKAKLKERKSDEWRFCPWAVSE
jgi:hypothetical protein